MDINSTLLIPDISNWCRQQEETHSTNAGLSSVVHGYSSYYHIVSEWRPVLHFAEMLWAGGSQQPHAKPFPNN